MFEGLTASVTGNEPVKGKFAATIVSSKWAPSKNSGREQLAITFSIEKRLENGMLVDTAFEGTPVYSYNQFTDMGNKFLLPMLVALGHEHTKEGEVIHMPFTDLVEEHNITSISELGAALAPTMEGRTIGLQLYVTREGKQGVGSGYFPVDEDDLIDFD